MNQKLKWTSVVLSFFFVEVFTQSDIYKEIYDQLDYNDVEFCTRYLNETSSVGCSSDLFGNIGILFVANTTDDVHSFLGNNKLDYKYVLGIPMKLFVSEKLTQQIRNSSKIVGLLVLNGSLAGVSFSEGLKCPNKKYNYKSSEKCGTIENAFGSGYAYMSWPFPVVLVQRQSQLAVESCFKTFNSLKNGEMSSSIRRCAVRMISQMSAVKNAKLSISRNLLVQNPIQAMVDRPIFSYETNGSNHFIWLNNSQKMLDRSISLLICRIDGHSMFGSFADHVHTVLVSLSVMMSVASRLMREMFSQNQTSEADVIFAFLSGESLDYLGSNWLAYTLNNGGLQLNNRLVKARHIKEVVELGPLGLAVSETKIGSIFLHTSEDSVSDDLVMDITRNAGAQFDSLTQNKVELYPSSSLHSFKRHGFNIPMTVLTDYKDPNHRFPTADSFLDTIGPSGVNFIDNHLLTPIAQMIYGFLFERRFGQGASPTPKKEWNFTFVPEDLFVCQFQNMSCDFFRKFTSESVTNRYEKAHKKFQIPQLLQRIVVQFGGFHDTSLDSNDKCTGDDFNYYWITENDTRNCYKSLYTQDYAKNPFDYVRDFTWNDERKYPIWQASGYFPLSVELFLEPREFWRITPLVVGLVVTLAFVVFFVLYWCLHFTILIPMEGSPEWAKAIGLTTWINE